MQGRAEEFPDGHWRRLSKEGWLRVYAAGDVRDAAIEHVSHVLSLNRGYIGGLGEDELSRMIVNDLLYHGWTLTPPKEDSDDGSEHGGDHRSGD